MANNYFDFKSFNDSDCLTDSLKDKIIECLSAGIKEKDYATLVLSGGSTPKKLLNKLSCVELDWHKVRVTLVDERWVDPLSTQSNEKLVRDNFLINKAEKARFFHLKTNGQFAKDSITALNVTFEKLSSPLDVVILGMGLDGHTASFFPYSKELAFMLSTDDFVCASTATVEPKERVTLSKNYLLSTQHLFLHIEGKKKKEVFLKASESDDISKLPIVAMMQQQTPLLEVYYAD